MGMCVYLHAYVCATHHRLILNHNLAAWCKMPLPCSHNCYHYKIPEQGKDTYDHLLPLGLRQRTPISLLADPYIQNVFMQLNCPLAGLGILPFSGHFGGKFSTPTSPAVHSIPWLSLSPYQRLTRERFWPLEIFFSFLFHPFWCMVTWPPQAPRDHISPPWSRPRGHPYVISVFSLLLGIHG